MVTARISRAVVLVPMAGWSLARLMLVLPTRRPVRTALALLAWLTRAALVALVVELAASTRRTPHVEVLRLVLLLAVTAGGPRAAPPLSLVVAHAIPVPRAWPLTAPQLRLARTPR